MSIQSAASTTCMYAFVNDTFHTIRQIQIYIRTDTVQVEALKSQEGVVAKTILLRVRLILAYGYTWRL